MWMLAAALLSSPSMADDDTPTSYKHSSSADHAELKWVRDSVEYAMVTTQTYRVAAERVERQKRKLRKQDWGVVLDVDETVLDNSTYQLERAAYGVGFEPGSWYAWCDRAAAPAVPGVQHLLDTVRDAGGKVVFVTNRDEVVRQATRDNLMAEGLWADGDVLCLRNPDDDAYTKIVRRTEARTGEGKCSTGEALNVVAYFGDNIHDFPAPGEEDGVDWDAQFGERYYVLPNPLYGGWQRNVTAPLR